MSSNDLLNPITPGEILREDFMEPMDISINQLSRDLVVPPVQSDNDLSPGLVPPASLDS